MTAEDIGSLYPTKIPAYTDNADIKAALRLYHYGSSTYDPTNTDPSNIPSTSIAGKLKSIEDDILAIEAAGTGSEISSTQPSSPVNGYIWVDSSAPGTEKTAYIYNSGTWYKMSGEIDVTANYSWSGTHNYSNTITAGSELVAKVGINNFINTTARDNAIPSPTAGTIAFIRQDNLGNILNELQYYYNGWNSLFASPVFSGAVIEKVDVQNTYIPGTYNFDIGIKTISYFTVASENNSFLNFRWNSSTSLNSKLSIGDSASAIVIMNNSSVGRYIAQIAIDGLPITPKWIDGLIPTTGIINSLNLYSFTIIKTADAQFTILASRAKFS